MLGNLSDPARTMLIAWLVVIVLVGGISAVVSYSWPRARRWLPCIISVLLGLVGLAIFGLLAADKWALIRQALLTGFVLSRSGEPGLSWLQGAVLVCSLGAGLAIAFGAFQLEKTLLRVNRRSKGSEITPIESLGLPGRRESMAGVASAADHPRLFVGLSVWSALGEEALFRGGMLVAIWASGTGLIGTFNTYWPLIVFQGILFGLIHIAFGTRTVLAKSVLGIGLGVTSLMIGVGFGALLPHIFHQLLVLRQFKKPEAKGQFNATRSDGSELCELPTGEVKC